MIGNEKQCLIDNNKFLKDCIFNRRSIRSFTSDKVSRETIELLLEFAIMAPSGSNAQPWSFIVVDDKHLCNKIKMFSPGLNGEPACIVIFCIDLESIGIHNEQRNKELSATTDLAMAAQNFMLAAYSYSLGTCAVKSFQPSLVREILHIPHRFSPELIVTVGYPQRIPKTPKRKSLDEILYWNAWEDV